MQNVQQKTAHVCLVVTHLVASGFPPPLVQVWTLNPKYTKKVFAIEGSMHIATQQSFVQTYVSFTTMVSGLALF